jgi:hypothetical protein
VKRHACDRSSAGPKARRPASPTSRQPTKPAAAVVRHRSSTGRSRRRATMRPIVDRPLLDEPLEHPARLDLAHAARVAKGSRRALEAPPRVVARRTVVGAALARRVEHRVVIWLVETGRLRSRNPCAIIVVVDVHRLGSGRRRRPPRMGSGRGRPGGGEASLAKDGLGDRRLAVGVGAVELAVRIRDGAC